MSTHFRHAISAACATLCLGVLLCGCTPSESQQKESLLQHCDYNPSHFLLSQLSTHRAVLLGDSGHGSSLYMQTVISFLNYWLDTVRKDDGLSGDIPRKLFLILERDSLGIERIKKYWETSDVYDVSADGGFFNTIFTTSSLEYLSDLHAFSTRVADYNATADEEHRVSFDIYGPEKVIDIADWSRAKGARFFVHERDEYSSEKVLALLEQNPDWKALMFYGSMHLNRSHTLKVADSLSDSGYFLAHYISDGLASTGGLYLVYQLSLRHVGVDSTVWRAPYSSYGVDIAAINCPSVTTNPWVKGQDAYILWYQWTPKDRPVMYLQSDNLVRATIRGFNTWTNMENDFYRTNFKFSYLYLSTISGIDVDTTVDYEHSEFIPQTTRKWKDWYASAKLDVVSDIESGAVLDRLLDQTGRSTGVWARRYAWMLAGMACEEPERDTTLTPADLVALYKDKLVYDRRPIMIDHLVNLLWVGTPEECEKARVILKRETGQDFSTAKEWMVWYRQNRDNIWNRQP
jgi:hypothetical protein